MFKVSLLVTLDMDNNKESNTLRTFNVQKKLVAFKG